MPPCASATVRKAVEMKRRIQEQIYLEARDLTPEELLAYFHARIAGSRFADFLLMPEAEQRHPQTIPVTHA